MPVQSKMHNARGCSVEDAQSARLLGRRGPRRTAPTWICDLEEERNFSNSASQKRMRMKPRREVGQKNLTLARQKLDGLVNSSQMKNQFDQV